MVEIAICLGIIGIALVAIIGMMPTGMRAAQDNREETIINQDAQYFLQAIRLGAPGDEQLAEAVLSLKTNGTACQFTNATQVIGYLSTPGTSEAIVRSLSGPIADKGTDVAVKSVAFKYRLTVNIEPFQGANAEVGNYLHDLRLKFEWPMRPDGTRANRPGTGSPKVFHTLVSGRLLETNIVTSEILHFFRP